MKTAEYRYGVEVVNGNDAWALFVACARGDLRRAKSLLAKDRRLANAQYWYQFPMHMAVREGHADLVQLLLDHGADPGQSRYTYNSWDKLLQVATERRYERVASVLTKAMRKRFAFDPGFARLATAIQARKPRQVTSLLRQHPDLATTADALGNNALHWAVITRQLPLIERFIQLGTPLNAQRADGQTPLLLAVNESADYWYRETRTRSHPSLRNTSVIVGHLLASGAPYDISTASAIGDQERVEVLLRKEPELARRIDSARMSPLSYAARAGYTHLVRLLLNQGADPNLPEEAAPRGRALFEACAANHLETVQVLLETGADPNAGVDSCGFCLTIGAVYHGKRAKPIQKLLRRYGARTPAFAMSVKELKQALREENDVVRDDEFAWQVMRKCDRKLLDLYLDSAQALPEGMQSWNGVNYPRSPRLVRRLLARGLDPNRPDWLGKTFLHSCADNGDRAVAALFLDAGADIHARELERRETPLETACRAAETDDSPRRQRLVRFLRELEIGD